MAKTLGAIAATTIIFIAKGYIENKFGITLGWEPTIFAIATLTYFETTSDK